MQSTVVTKSVNGSNARKILTYSDKLVAYDNQRTL